MSNNMLDILKNFEDASTGKKPGAAAASSNEMKKILESFQSVQESNQPVEECGEMAMPAPATEGQPVTVSVTASGKDNVADLIALMQQAAGIEQHVDMPMAHDASHNTGDADMAAMRKAMMAADEEIEEDERYQASTSPDEEYKDHNFMTKDLSGGINKRKKSYKAAEPGDNAMAVESIKDRLWAALNEKKAVEGKYANDAQRKAVHAAKDKKKKK